MVDRNLAISINVLGIKEININVKELNNQLKDRKARSKYCFQAILCKYKDINRLKAKGWEKKDIP